MQEEYILKDGVITKEFELNSDELIRELREATNTKTGMENKIIQFQEKIIELNNKITAIQNILTEAGIAVPEQEIII